MRESRVEGMNHFPCSLGTCGGLSHISLMRANVTSLYGFGFLAPGSLVDLKKGHDCFLSNTEFLLIPSKNAMPPPLNSNGNVRFSKAPRTALGRYVNLCIAPPMRRLQLCADSAASPLSHGLGAGEDYT